MFLFVQGKASVIPNRKEESYFQQVVKAMDILRISVSCRLSKGAVNWVNLHCSAQICMEVLVVKCWPNELL